MFQFNPLDIDSKGGQYLINAGDFHLGDKVNRMNRIRLLNTEATTESKTIDDSVASNPRFGTLMGKDSL